MDKKPSAGGKRATDYRVSWVAGPHAELELNSPKPGSGHGVYQVRYTSPFRSTLRPPPKNCNLGAAELEPLHEDLNRLVTFLDTRAAGVPGPAEAPAGDPIRAMEEITGILYNLTVPRYAQTELRQKDLFLDIGLDEALLAYPWELLHDGENFLCLKHNVGRFVNAAAPVYFETERPASPAHFPKISVLLVSVPTPQRKEGVYSYLPQAEAEAKAIAKTLTAYPALVRVDPLCGPNATFNAVVQKLKSGQFQIVHFCGHAKFDDDDPRASSLVLHDRDMTTGVIATYFTPKPPVLCFVNGCETARTAQGKDRLNVYGLAQTFLQTGAYLLGTRWKVSDTAAATFAAAFYEALIAKHVSLGEAVRKARIECRKAAPDDFAWASYILYGDPRVCFRKA